MKIAASLPSLFLLLFAFSTQILTLAVTYVKDIDGNALVPGKKYHILDASNYSRGIQTELVRHQNCPVSVIIGADAKKVIFQTEIEHQQRIKVGEFLHIEFSEVSTCARSGNWTVEIQGEKRYPVLIGPPEGAKTMDGKFLIKKSKDMDHAYNIAFALYEVDEYSLAAIPYGSDRYIMRVEFCKEAFNVVFSLYKEPVPTPHPSPQPPPLAPPPPPLTPPPPSTTPAQATTFVPLIRKIVR
ncbi:uncharacterized protein LOC129286315 [Prosopis cineraria]|uniref:uncharacterized protein LOC129286315 n=1 Tax=Prosopis cineraria TaxID=364024 RepID=UPI00240F221C|nr:uncharacterized protein LOC129286315 [Prosopis cineraria]